MAKRVQFRRGTSTQHDSFTGALGEVTVDTTLKTIRVHDNVKVGGNIIATKDFVEGNIDTIEGNIDTIEGNIDTIEGSISTIEGDIDIIEGNVSTLQGNVSTLNSNVATLNNTTVKLTGDQNVGGIKTFNSSPIVPTPTTDFQVATKEYVDSKPIDINALSNKAVPVNTDNFVLQEVGENLRKVSFQNLTNLSPNDTRVKTALNASGDAPIYACRAWVNFNGTGTVAIRASGNVSSITDNGLGNYTVNFLTAMPDSNYCVNETLAKSANLVNTGRIANPMFLSTTSFRLSCVDSANTGEDMENVFASVFR